MLKRIHRHMRSQVIDAVERHTKRRGIRLRGCNADKQGANQSWTSRYGNRIDVTEFYICFSKGAFHTGNHRFKVRTTRNFGDNSTEPGVLIHATRHNIRKQRAPSDDADAGLIT
jgi:hypothetical protein